MRDSLPQDAYNEIADSYAEKIDTKPHNAYYDRPAIKSLVSHVNDMNILDAGCGPGVYTEWLIKNNAKVVGIDANEKMIQYAKKRNGDKATFLQANLEEPLCFFEDTQFGGIISPLTITYCKDLKKVFTEFAGL